MKYHRVIQLSVFLACLMVVSASAQVPFLLHYQAKVAKADGTPLDGPGYTVSFTLWDAAVGGMNLWSQTITGVEMNKGVFHVLLGGAGSTRPLSELAWDRPYYLEVGITGVAQFTDRTPIVSVPFAFRAQDANTVGGRRADGTPNNLPVLNAEGKLPGTMVQDKTLGAAQLADGAVTADKVAAGAVGNPQLAANAVGQANIAAGSIRREHVYDNQIITGHLDNNAVTSAKIADGAIDIQDIKDGAVIDAKISGVAAGKISGQVGTAQIADGAVTARKAKLGAWTTGIIGAGWTYSDYVGASYWQEIAFPGASLTISLETTSVVLMLFKCTIALKSGDRGNPDFVCYVDGAATWEAQAQVADAGWEGWRTAPCGFHMQVLGPGTHTLQMRCTGNGQNFKVWNAELSAIAFAQ